MSITLQYVILCFVVIILSSQNSGSDKQQDNNMDRIDDRIHTISTLIDVHFSFARGQGTGFFYHQLSEKDPLKNYQWRTIEKSFLVTNRHVVLKKINSREIIPDSLIFYLRKSEKSEVLWEPITLAKKDIIERMRVHPNPKIDVCIIDVLDLMNNKIKNVENIFQRYGVSKDDFPGKNKINVDIASEAVVIGYPFGFYDKVNKFPIVKSGIVSSRWGLNFNGEPYFLIDAKLFPGSSGSIVISRPTNIVFDKGNLYKSENKEFAFLGIFSGEPIRTSNPVELGDITITKQSGYNLGIVWYGWLIEDIIKYNFKIPKPNSSSER